MAGIHMLSKQDSFAQSVINCNEKISQLPAGEMKYYLFILVNSIKEKNNQMTKEFLKELSILIDNLIDLHKMGSFDPDLFNQITEHYNQLQTIAKTNTFAAKTKIILLQTGATIASVICGIIGGLIGGVIGIVRGTWNLEPFKGLGIGLFTGYFLGAIVGFRLPKKLFKDELIRQIQFGFDGLNKSLDNLECSLKGDNKEIKPFEVYYEEKKASIRSKCFDNDSDFEEFLNDDVTYEINSFKAGFIGGKSLHGYLGQHLYIVININKVEYLIEFTQDPADTTEKPDQQEIRTVKGSKIIEMIAAYEKQLETTPCTLTYVAHHMKPGDNDCKTFVDKILLATNQRGTRLTRYEDMNNVGTMIGFFIKKVSPFKEDFFTTPELALK